MFFFEGALQNWVKISLQEEVPFQFFIQKTTHFVRGRRKKRGGGLEKIKEINFLKKSFFPIPSENIFLPTSYISLPGGPKFFLGFYL